MADMARRTTTTPPPEDFVERIVDIDVADEMQGTSSSTPTRSSTRARCPTPGTG